MAHLTHRVSFVTAGLLVTAGLVVSGCAEAMTFSRTERTEARIALSEGDYETAAITFSKQIARNPKDYKAHFHLGEAQWAAGRRPEAVRSYKTALDVMPLTPAGRNDDEYRMLVLNELSRGLAQSDTDGSQLANIEASSKGNSTYKLLIGMTYAKAGQPDSAIAAFREARSIDRENPQIAKEFGMYLESIQQDLAAEEVLRRAYALNPQDEEVAAALRRLGIVPGPAILSKNQLSKPAMPLGPLPEVRLRDPDGEPTEDETTGLN